MSEVKTYVEKPASAVISRRTFLKIFGVGVAVTALGAYKLTDIVLQRNKYIKLRQRAQWQRAQYQDDKGVRERYRLAVSHQNPMLKRFYSEFATHPLSETSESLLHTGYAPRVKTFPMGV